MDREAVNRNIEGDIISSGMASGTLCFIDFQQNGPVNKNEILRKEIAGETARFKIEIKLAVHELKEIINALKKDDFLEEANIVQSHIMMLEDNGFQKKVFAQIRRNNLTAEIALERVLREIVIILENSENSHFAQLGNDLRDIELRLKKHLRREDTSIFKGLLEGIADPIVAMRQLLPSAVLEARTIGVRAIITEDGSHLSHAAILAKSFDIPVLKVKNLVELRTRNYTEIMVDAKNGRIVVNPDKEEITGSTKKAEIVPALGELKLPARLWVNIVDPEQMKGQILKDIKGIGLYRTEFFFIHDRMDFPDEEEQYANYSALFRMSRNIPVTIRTLDIGGDKTHPYISFGPQENPYLGLRAHRIYRFHPEIFVTQIKAILRAAYPSGHTRILYPMIESLDSLLSVQELLNEAIRMLENESIVYNPIFEQGVLIEVPSAVWDFRQLLLHIDFASLGTNDLFQYLFAVDRNNVNVHDYYQPENPLAIRMLKSLADTAKELDKPLSICGEIASDTRFLPILIGLGIENLSVDLRSIPIVRNHLSTLDVSDCRALVQKCLTATRTQDVKKMLDDFHSSDNHPPFQNLGTVRPMPI
jgi:phosphotransferase system enzyme I (PtsI)